MAPQVAAVKKKIISGKTVEIFDEEILTQIHQYFSPSKLCTIL